MNEIEWERLMKKHTVDLNGVDESTVLCQLKRRVTFIKCRSNGHTYSRIYYLTLSEDAIQYQGSKRAPVRVACKIKDIDQIRPGFTTRAWKNCLEKGIITRKDENLAFSILYDNNRNSLDLLADTELLRSEWVHGLNYLIDRYRSHMRTHTEITNQWIWYLFSKADRDESGHLNRNEVRRVLMSLNIELDEETINRYFARANIRRNNYEQLENLDKDEFLIFYKYVSHRPELLKIICHFNGNNLIQTRKLLSEYETVTKLASIYRVSDELKSPSINFSPLRSKKTSSSLFLCRRQGSSSSNHDNVPSTPDITNKNNYLTVEQLQKFLKTEQKLTTITIEDCAKLIHLFEPSLEGQTSEQIGIDGLRMLLLHDEFCIMNPNKSRRVYQDMTRPITDYFISTSHNTYIRDNQVYGDGTPETYIHALRTGCRAVEMDCYDGDNIEPVVYHGNTLVTPITFREIINAIKTELFAVSPYPVFLNIENHCSYEQQGVMADLLKTILGDYLLTEPLVNDYEKLPSPEDLKYKVIVRSRRYPKGKIPADPKSGRSDDESEPNPHDYHPDFSNLIIYSQTVSFTNLEHTLSTQKCFHSISFKESKADDFINAKSSEHLDLILLTQKHLVRVYPGASRQDSSNLDPIKYWIYGVQMAALNYQTNDRAMWLQDGLFSDNGGCGYVLKPSYLLRNGPLFDPKEKSFKRGKHIQIYIISGQHLSKEKGYSYDKDIVDPYVEVFTCGIPRDTNQRRTRSVHNNGLNPIWDQKINIDIYCPDLCLIIFEARDRDRLHRSSFLGQSCIPFAGLQSGYRHIKLKAKNGDYTCGTLFVHIGIEDN